MQYERLSDPAKSNCVLYVNNCITVKRHRERKTDNFENKRY